MLTAVHPKLPMRDKEITQKYYTKLLGFQVFGDDHREYLMLQKDNIQLHFFLFETLDPLENYGQTYIRTNDIDTIYQQFIDQGVPIHPNGALEHKPWGQTEFSLLDPDNNLLIFGQTI